MDIISYIQIMIGMVLMWLWGRVLINNDIFSSFLAGAASAGCILSFTVRFIPIYTREILIVLVLLGLIKFLFDYKNKNFSVDFDLQILPVLLIISLFFRIFHYQNWLIESHDLFYFSPSIEMLNANYFGNIRVSYYYPYELASTHLLSSGFIASIGFVNLEPNLLYCLEIRYIVVIIFVANFLFKIYQRKRIKPWLYCIGVYFLFFIYGEEITYELLISSYIYVFLLFQIFLCSISNGKENETLFFAILLIAAKAPIFYIATCSSFYLWFRYKSIRFSPSTIFATTIVFLALLTMVIIPQSDERIIFSIVNPFNKIDLISFSGIYNWFMPDNFKLFIDNYIDITSIGMDKNWDFIDILKEKIVSVAFLGLLLIYLIIKYYLPFYYLNMKHNNKYNIFFIYMSVSLIGWITLRNGGVIAHQAHGYILASIVSFMFILYYSTKKTILYIILPIGLAYLLGNDFTKINSRILLGRKNGKFMKYNKKDLIIDNNEYYKPDRNGPYWKSEYKAMILGKRILADDILMLENRATKNFVLPGSDKKYSIDNLTLERLHTDGLPNTIIDQLNKIKDNVIIGDKRFETVLVRYLNENDILLYLDIIKYRARK